MAPRTRGASLGGTLTGGIIPERFGTVSPSPITVSDQPNSPPTVDPLSSIAQLCPHLERPLNDALTTVDDELQIVKYEALTKRCPNSAPLLMFLCEAYQRGKKSAATKRCLEQVLMLDPENPEATKMMADTTGRLR